MEPITNVSNAPQDVAAGGAKVAADAQAKAASKSPPAQSKPKIDYDPAAARVALEDAINKLNESAQTRLRDLAFRVDDVSGRAVISVVSSRTGEMVRQIPSEVAIKVAHQIEDALGLFFDKRA